MNEGETRRSALVVAVWEYVDERFRRLRSPSRDAEELAEVLGDGEIGGYAVETSLNEGEGEVTRRLEGFFADRTSGETLLLHLSCHGVKDASGELYFVAADTQLDRLLSTAISSSLLTRLMRESRAGRVVVFLDCCYSGAFTHELLPRADDQVDVESRLGGEGRAVITASKSTEYAFEDNVLVDELSKPSPSVFTTALVRGLRSGNADLDRDGLISFSDIYGYVYDEVTKTTQNQTPGALVQVEGRFFVAHSRRPAELPADVKELLDSDRPVIRLAGIPELEKLLVRPHPGFAAVARSTLEHLAARDDSEKVKAAAQKVLDDHGFPEVVAGPPETEVVAPEPEEEFGEPVLEPVPAPVSVSEPEPEPEPQPAKPVPEPESVAPSEPTPAPPRRWLLAGAGIAVMAVVGIVALLASRDGDDGGGGPRELAWSEEGSVAELGGAGSQEVNGIAASSASAPIAVGSDFNDDRAVQAVWMREPDGWRRRRFAGGLFDAVAVAPSAASGLRAVAVGRVEDGNDYDAAIWTLGGADWVSACGDQCGEASAPEMGPEPRAQEAFAVTALRSRPGEFLAVGRDPNKAGDGLHDGAAWRIDSSGRVTRLAIRDPAIAGDLQQQMLAVVETDSGVVAAGQYGHDAGVWRSTDGGERWNRLDDPTLQGDDDTTLRILGLAVRGKDLVAVGWEGNANEGQRRAAVWLFRGATGTWERGTSADFLPRGQWMRAVTVAPDGTLVAVGLDDYDPDESPRPAVWTSPDGERWSLRPGLPAGPGEFEIGAVTVAGDALLSGGYGRRKDGRDDAHIWTTTGLG